MLPRKFPSSTAKYTEKFKEDDVFDLLQVNKHLDQHKYRGAANKNPLPQPKARQINIDPLRREQKAAAEGTSHNKAQQQAQYENERFHADQIQPFDNYLSKHVDTAVIKNNNYGKGDFSRSQKEHLDQYNHHNVYPAKTPRGTVSRNNIQNEKNRGDQKLIPTAQTPNQLSSSGFGSYYFENTWAKKFLERPNDGAENKFDFRRRPRDGNLFENHDMQDNEDEYDPRFQHDDIGRGHSEAGESASYPQDINHRDTQHGHYGEDDGYSNSMNPSYRSHYNPKSGANAADDGHSNGTEMSPQYLLTTQDFASEEELQTALAYAAGIPPEDLKICSINPASGDATVEIIRYPVLNTAAIECLTADELANIGVTSITAVPSARMNSQLNDNEGKDFKKEEPHELADSSENYCSMNHHETIPELDRSNVNANSYRISTGEMNSESANGVESSTHSNHNTFCSRNDDIFPVMNKNTPPPQITRSQVSESGSRGFSQDGGKSDQYPDLTPRTATDTQVWLENHMQELEADEAQRRANRQQTDEAFAAAQNTIQQLIVKSVPNKLEKGRIADTNTTPRIGTEIDQVSPVTKGRPSGSHEGNKNREDLRASESTVHRGLYDERSTATSLSGLHDRSLMDITKSLHAQRSIRQEGIHKSLSHLSEALLVPDLRSPLRGGTRSINSSVMNGSEVNITNDSALFSRKDLERRLEDLERMVSDRDMQIAGLQRVVDEDRIMYERALQREKDESKTWQERSEQQLNAVNRQLEILAAAVAQVEHDKKVSNDEKEKQLEKRQNENKVDLSLVIEMQSLHEKEMLQIRDQTAQLLKHYEEETQQHMQRVVMDAQASVKNARQQYVVARSNMFDSEAEAIQSHLMTCQTEMLKNAKDQMQSEAAQCAQKAKQHVLDELRIYLLQLLGRYKNPSHDGRSAISPMHQDLASQIKWRSENSKKDDVLGERSLVTGSATNQNQLFTDADETDAALLLQRLEMAVVEEVKKYFRANVCEEVRAAMEADYSSHRASRSDNELQKRVSQIEQELEHEKKISLQLATELLNLKRTAK